MTAVGRALIIGAFLWGPGPAGAGGLMPGSGALVIRVYRPADATLNPGGWRPGAPLPDLTLTRTIEEARAILQDAGIGARWIVCGAPGPGQDPGCDTPLADTDLAVRFVRSAAAPDASTAAASMGYALIEQAHHAALATILVDRVEWLAARADVDLSQLTGRAVAHEVGHLLLATQQHSQAGLMRARWSVDELRQPSPVPWRFTGHDARALRVGVAARLHREHAEEAAARVVPRHPPC